MRFRTKLIGAKLNAAGGMTLTFEPADRRHDQAAATGPFDVALTKRDAETFDPFTLGQAYVLDLVEAPASSGQFTRGAHELFVRLTRGG